MDCSAIESIEDIGGERIGLTGFKFIGGPLKTLSVASLRSMIIVKLVNCVAAGGSFTEKEGSTPIAILCCSKILYLWWSYEKRNVNDIFE